MLSSKQTVVSKLHADLTSESKDVKKVGVITSGNGGL